MIPYEQAHDKTCNKTCATSVDSDQFAHPRSLIEIFAYCLCFLQPQGYSKRDTRESLSYCVNAEADLSLCWSYSIIVGFYVRWLAQL